MQLLRMDYQCVKHRKSARRVEGPARVLLGLGPLDMVRSQRHLYAIVRPCCASRQATRAW